tara:strand:- start:45 stop:431 length:387 start_codon:yes stop_codon:yes gene_type:complete
MKSNIIRNKFSIKKTNSEILIKAFDINHGMINATGYLIDKLAYISDCKRIPKKNLNYLFNLDYLIIDCLKYAKHPSHFNYEEAIKLIRLVKPKKSILTNLHTDMDYFKLKKKLPENIIPAFDGLNFSF